VKRKKNHTRNDNNIDNENSNSAVVLSDETRNMLMKVSRFHTEVLKMSGQIEALQKEVNGHVTNTGPKLAEKILGVTSFLARSEAQREHDHMGRSRLTKSEEERAHEKQKLLSGYSFVSRKIDSMSNVNAPETVNDTEHEAIDSESLVQWTRQNRGMCRASTFASGTKFHSDVLKTSSDVIGKESSAGSHPTPFSLAEGNKITKSHLATNSGGIPGPRVNPSALSYGVCRVSHAALRRLARRGGVRRISKTAYQHISADLKEMVNEVYLDLYWMLSAYSRKIVMPRDIAHVISKRGPQILGMGIGFNKSMYI